MRDLRITRPESPITLDEWIAAVNKVEGVRLAGGNTPRQSHSGHAEVYSPKFGEWAQAFRWMKSGEASFKPDDSEDVVRIAYLVARELRAVIVDSDGNPVGEASLM